MTVTICVYVIKGKGNRIVFPVVVDTIVIYLINRHGLLYKAHLIDYQRSILTSRCREQEFRLTRRPFVRIHFKLNCCGCPSADNGRPAPLVTRKLGERPLLCLRFEGQGNKVFTAFNTIYLYIRGYRKNRSFLIGNALEPLLFLAGNHCQNRNKQTV